MEKWMAYNLGNLRHETQNYGIYRQFFGVVLVIDLLKKLTPGSPPIIQPHLI
jgi:hypothetical protein